MTTGSPIPVPHDRPPPRRSATGKIAGVAGGLSDASGVDPSIIRIGFAVLSLASGAGMVAYLGAWLLMLPPRSDGGFGQPSTPDQESVADRPTPALIFGGVLLGAGLLVGLMTLGGFAVVPAAIIGLVFVGIVLLNRTSDSAQAMLDTDTVTTDTVATQPAPSFQPPPAPPQPTPPSAAPSSPDPPAPPPDPPAPAPPTDEWLLDDRWPPPDEQTRAHWALARTEGETTIVGKDGITPAPPLATITLAALALLTGVGLVFNTLIGEAVSAVTLAGIGTAIVGMAVVASAFNGRTRRLVPIAIAALIVLVASPVVEFAARDGIGGSQIRVSSLATLEDEYAVGIGSLDLRLDDLEVEDDTEIDVGVGIGSLQITVPADAIVEIRAHTKIGYIFLLDQERSGIDQRFTRIPGGRGTSDAPRLIINAGTDIGEVQVHRARGD